MRPRVIRKLVSRHANAGFSVIETMIAVLVLSVGILGLAAMLADALAYMNMSQMDYIAQQKAAETIESIYTARDMGQATWSSICNVGSSVCTGGIFLTGAQPLCYAGADGILGTADDYSSGACLGPADSFLLPGSSGTFSSAPQKVPLSNYSFLRTITISNTSVSNLRQIQVLITYRAARFTRSYTLTANISNFS